MQNNSKNDSEIIANYKKDALDQSFRDSVGTISKEGNRNYVVPQKPNGRLYNLRFYFSYFIWFCFSLYLLLRWRVSHYSYLMF